LTPTEKIETVFFRHGFYFRKKMPLPEPELPECFWKCSFPFDLAKHNTRAYLFLGKSERKQKYSSVKNILKEFPH